MRRRRHAEIRILGEKATLHDLGSTNGTFVNGQRIAGERALFDGDLMSFGREGPAVEFHAVTAAPPPDHARASAGTTHDAGETARGSAAGLRRHTGIPSRALPTPCRNRRERCARWYSASAYSS